MSDAACVTVCNCLILSQHHIQKLYAHLKVGMSLKHASILFGSMALVECQFCDCGAGGAMTLEGCPYLVNLTTLTAQCRAMCCDHAGAAECSAGTAPPAFEPVLVGFKAKMGGDGSGVVPVVLGEDAHKVSSGGQ